MTRQFSQLHAFTKEQVEEAAEAIAAENPRKRLLMRVTMGHRALALRQTIATTLLGMVAMLSLYLLERMAPTVEDRAFSVWAIATALNIAIRVSLSVWLFSTPPMAVVASLFWRLVPLLVAALASVQWIWSIELFAAQPLGANVFILFVGLLGVSIAVLSMWPVVPIAASVYLAATWPLFFYRILDAQSLPPEALALMALGVALLLWACVYLNINQIRTILDRSDEVELLIARLHEANVELKDANTKLAQLQSKAASDLEARSLFFSGASHDFRQRLHAMKLLAHSSLGETAARGIGVSALHRLSEAVEEVEQYVTKVLDFARFDRDNALPERGDLRLQSLFQQLELSFEDVALSSNTMLVFRTTDAVLHTDASMLRRILENLVSNAIKFSAAGVVVAARRRSGGIAIEIWDQGPGIAATERDVIFIPFRQSLSDVHRPDGVGLGLAIVKRFADCLGYVVEVRSKLGRGTVMAVLVPQQDVRGL